jgi:hypothetical protein
LSFSTECRRNLSDVRRRRAADEEQARRLIAHADAIDLMRWLGDALEGQPEKHPNLAGAIRLHLRSVNEKRHATSPRSILPTGRAKRSI